MVEILFGIELVSQETEFSIPWVLFPTKVNGTEEATIQMFAV